MKRFLLISLLITFQHVLSQNPLLLDNEWYVQKTTIGGFDYFPPTGGFQGVLYFSELEFHLSHPSCEQALLSEISYSGSDFFELEDFPAILLSNGCSPEDTNYMVQHEFIYYEDETLAKNPFSYVIEVDGADLLLTTENESGDKAYYSTYPLKTTTFTLFKINIYPNPVNNLVNINTNGSIANIHIYDPSGKLLIDKNGGNQMIVDIDVSGLVSGLYFARIQINKEYVVVRFVKN